MRQQRRVRLEPLPRPWLAQFVTGILCAVERLPFTSGWLVFGGDVPVLDVRRLTDTHLTPGSRYEYRQFIAFCVDVAGVPAVLRYSRRCRASHIQSPRDGHTVSRRQYKRRNAVQGLMLACSLLCRLDDEAAARKAL